MKRRTVETMSVEQASRRLGTHYRTTLKAAKSGELPCIKLGRQFLILKGPFEKMLKPSTPSKGAAA
jgi:excisionase family DNA binding protein